MAERAGALYLIPVPLGEIDARAALPASVIEVVHRLRRFVAEHPRTARRFLKSAGYPRPLAEARIETLDEHTPASVLDALLAPVLAGEDCGVMSEAGAPAVADPGADLVRLAHARGVRVVALTGPSAILLALMASGLNGQRFAFHGYLPVEHAPRVEKLRQIDLRAEHDDATQIFIEAPYRNDALLQAALDACRDDTLLCIAADISLPGEFIVTRTISQWRACVPALNRKPTVFLLGRDGRPRRSKS